MMENKREINREVERERQKDRESVRDRKRNIEDREIQKIERYRQRKGQRETQTHT